MRVAVLGSGSSGNALVVEADGTNVLVDCGLTFRQLRTRLESVGMRLGQIEAVLITHEHEDHVRGLEVLQRHADVPVAATAGTIEALGERFAFDGQVASGDELRIGDLTVTPVATSHDAREPVAFVFEQNGRRVGVATDTGYVTELLAERFSGCHALFLECNHDVDMLRYGPYPWVLKQRIASRLGHLSNDQAQLALERMASPELEIVVGMHLSRENNRPELARHGLTVPLAGGGVRVAVADQFEPLVVEVHGVGGKAGARSPEPGARLSEE